MSAKSCMGEILIFYPIADVAAQLGFYGPRGVANKARGGGRASRGHNREEGGEHVGVLEREISSAAIGVRTSATPIIDQVGVGIGEA